jgi:glycosyltransferase involved in cell wall biosynthesis
MPISRIVVCAAQVPFHRGGAEAHVEALVTQLRRRGYLAELVSLPFKWYPRDEILAHAAAWRLLDLSEANGQPIDLAIGTKFPSYFVRHPRKVAWVIHQFRGAYDLFGTRYSDVGHDEADLALREALLRLDREMLGECARIFTNARNTAERLAAYNGVAAEALYHPPPLAECLRAGPAAGYVLSVGRLEGNKRADLLIEAMAHVPPPLRLLVAGEGRERDAWARRAEALGLTGRVEFLGAVDDDTLVELYAGALAVGYAPFDEDFGYVTLEAFLARKAVVTTTDAGGPLEFVEHGVNGLVCDPSPAAVGEAFAALQHDAVRAVRLGEAGYERARLVTWDGVIERLVGAA